ncbi:major facilitator superfamily domain-containing protein [Lasiosphaeria miniovina]|uniref:Major facilitator superfamily domain-containing protein n=1 Tax=Lasiosphaeria miniovina TaxID=1954250 RepID=A0AA40DR94_9PEZI|nr:major facilitator superfamily domain-containing protein [Lasiosphaeria miniovina]KAK0713224.1 major facilitator superfamily domain-containing protein [Lasiosphaeria miniovina]
MSTAQASEKGDVSPVGARHVSNDLESTHAAASEELRNDSTTTKRLLRKLDLRILPVLILLVLCSFLDRTNVGNAKLYHLEADLGMTNRQYSQGLAAFYPLYIAAEVPSNLVLKCVTPQIWMALLTFAWGVVCICLGLIHNFPQFIGLRAILGLAEGGLFPGMVLYLSTIYTRAELALRIGVLYTATSLSGAFGGLLARVLAEIGTRGGLSSWRWIFVIEGLFTVVVAAVTFLVLPKNIASGYPSPQTWLTAGAYFGLLSAIYSFGLFLPTIIAGLGYTAEAQLWSVIPYAVAACTTLAVAFVSDRLKLRGTVMLGTMPVAIVGYAVIANVPNYPRVKYGMTFLMATGIYSSVPPVLAWLSNNSAGHYKGATAAALQLAVANCGGILSVFLYPDADGTLFHRGHSVVLGLLIGGWFLILANVLYCAKINSDKADGKYDKYTGQGDDREPDFRMVM